MTDVPEATDTRPIDTEFIFKSANGRGPAPDKACSPPRSLRGSLLSVGLLVMAIVAFAVATSGPRFAVGSAQAQVPTARPAAHADLTKINLHRHPSSGLGDTKANVHKLSLSSGGHNAKSKLAHGGEGDHGKKSPDKSGRANAGNKKKSAQTKSVHPHRLGHGPEYHPPYAEILVDDNSGAVLHEVDPDGPRHPASLTKIMTLYLLFEQLEAGKLNIDSLLPVSSHAALQPPTRIGVKAGQTIRVEDAIKSIVTRSANDAAVVVAEAIGGNEVEFAEQMTRKASALGMTSTFYVNASGLPADAQVTTARDQALLGRAIQSRFPTYSAYFAMPTFAYQGQEIHNHNNLLGQVEGMDGIKTGYTEASGYNLVASVRRNERHIVAVVLGSSSNGARDARMRQLIEDYIPQASTQRTAPQIVGVDPARPASANADAESTPVGSVRDAPSAASSPAAGGASRPAIIAADPPVTAASPAASPVLGIDPMPGGVP